MREPVDQRIDGETRLMGLLGEKIAYTRSPLLHNRAAALLGRNVVYLPLPLPRDQVAPFLAAAWQLGAVGFNVTQPHKSQVAELFPESGRRSVNTLYRGESGWRATSTDGEGFARGLERLGRPLRSFAKVTILGAGGATLALMEHLATLEAGPAAVTVLRRTGHGDAALQAAAPRGARLELLPFDATALRGALSGTGRASLLVQATSAPQRGDDLGDLVPGLEGFSGTLVDLVYGQPSALYFAAVARNLPAQDGEAMLIEQARLAQELWWGCSAPYQELASALRGK